jgi:D-erythro-7,8-dihydroneopterin triphosphate epimerase
MAIVRISNLKLRTIIGNNDWERDIKQDLVINVTFAYDARKASESDDIKDAVDYKTITKKIIQHVEGSQYHLIEKLAATILKIVMDIPAVQLSTVKIDKPQALRFADSVSIELSDSKKKNE